MKFSLLNVSNEHPDGTVDGVLIQDHCGDMESAKAWKERVDKANNGKVNFAVVPFIRTSICGGIFYRQKRLI